MMNRERMTRSNRMTGGGATSLGLSERLERVLAYLLVWFSGLILFFVERKNRNVQFHAKQSMAVFIPLCLIWWLLGFLGGILSHIPLIGGILLLVFGFVGAIVGWSIIVLAVWLMIMAWFRPNYRLPIIGDWIRY